MDRTTSVRRVSIYLRPSTARSAGSAPIISTCSSSTASTRSRPPEEVLATLDVLVRAGKIRYVGVSNFSGWHLMKSLAVADKYGFRATSPTRPTIR